MTQARPSVLRRRASTALFADLERQTTDVPLPIRRGLHRLGADAYVATVSLTVGSGEDFGGSGVAADAVSAEGVAWLEALERYLGAEPRGGKGLLRAPRKALAVDSLDPATAILHSAEDYADPRNRCTPYDDALSVDWVEGWSLRLDTAGCVRLAPLLAPAQLAYFRHREATPSSRFVYDSSNGCAVGSGLREAILFGLLEVIERDAELSWWLSGVAPPRFAIDKVELPALVNVLSAAHARGFEVAMHDVSHGARVPVVQVALRGRSADGEPVVAVAACARPDAERAAVHALREALTAAWFRPALSTAERDRAEELVRDPDAVARPDDHRLFFSIPQGQATLATLFAGEMDLPLTGPIGPAVDAREALRRGLGDALDRHGRVIVVDQTSQAIRSAGLRGVKVLVPGAMPLTFGRQYRRLDKAWFDRFAASDRGPGATPPNAPHPFL